jgi:hypothetical protein
VLRVNMRRAVGLQQALPSPVARVSCVSSEEATLNPQAILRFVDALRKRLDERSDLVAQRLW